MKINLQLAMVSLRAGFSPLFVCLRASRFGPSATRETAAKVVGRQDGSSFFLSSGRPQAVHNRRGRGLMSRTRFFFTQSFFYKLDLNLLCAPKNIINYCAHQQS